MRDTLDTRAIAIALTLLMATCASSPSAQPASPVTVVLAPGASKRVPDTDLTVKFEAVVSDSRCPTGAQCVWAGDVAVRIQMTVVNTPPATAVLHLNPSSAREVVHGGWRIQLVDVTPAPTVEGRARAEDYRVTLRIDRHSSR